MTMVGNKKSQGGQREKNKLEKRERIRRAAWELFTTEGYEATTTKAVARRAGVAAGTVFLYASDKRDLLFLVMHDRLSEAVLGSFATLPRSARLEDQLLHVFRALFRMYGEHPAVASEFVRAHPVTGQGPNAQAVEALTMTFVFRIAQLVQAAAQRGEVDPAIEPTLAAQNLFGLYFAALFAWLSGYATLEAALDRGLRSSIELLMRGLAPR